MPMLDEASDERAVAVPPLYPRYCWAFGIVDFDRVPANKRLHAHVITNRRVHTRTYT